MNFIFRLSKRLPSLNTVFENSNIDIDVLESQFSLLNSKYGKTKIGLVSSNEVFKSPSSNKKILESLQKKRKRKIILPKNYNPNVAIDSERWLPLRERSYFKGKRRKRNAVGKGTQGAVLTK
jgi:signal recognition particle subunit SRP72